MAATVGQQIQTGDSTPAAGTQRENVQRQQQQLSLEEKWSTECQRLSREGSAFVHRFFQEQPLAAALQLQQWYEAVRRITTEMQCRTVSGALPAAGATQSYHSGADNAAVAVGPPRADCQRKSSGAAAAFRLAGRSTPPGARRGSSTSSSAFRTDL